MSDSPHWDESDSQRFIDLGRVYTPRRDELLTAFLDLVPGFEDDAFTGVELGTGAGWLIEGILERYPRAHMFGLDGSPAMITETSQRLARFGERASIGHFELSDPAWKAALPNELHLVVSSLVIHHLKADAKRAFFSELFEKLAPGGALLICDVVEPAGRWGRRHMSRAWDADVQRQSLEITNAMDAYDHFISDKWNLFEYPEEDGDIDFPTPLADQLQWLREIGYIGVDAWWVRAGHALFGGYRP